MSPTSYLIFFATNLVFIATHLYGWLLKWFYQPKAYKARFHELFPAQKAVGVIYLLQLLELPYLVQAGRGATSAVGVTDGDGLFADALLYVNAFGLMCFSFQMLVMCEGYFFPQRDNRIRLSSLFNSRFSPFCSQLLLLFPAVLVVCPLLLPALGLVSYPDGWQLWAKVDVFLAFVYYFWLNVRMALKIGRAIRRANEDIYADTDDFPLQFAQFIQWVPTLVLLLHILNFYLDDPWAKFIRDLIFIGANVAFCIFTLNPWRKGINNPATPSLPVKEESDSDFRLNENRYTELARRLDILLKEERIFTEPHITSDVIMKQLGINSNYLSEVIRRSGYSSFYDMVNQHRVRYAISLIVQKPSERLAVIAERSGFSSQASMSKAFKAQGKESPSSFKAK